MIGALLSAPALAEESAPAIPAENAFQQAADAKRVYDVHLIAGLVEKYKAKKGFYPFGEIKPPDLLHPEEKPEEITPTEIIITPCILKDEYNRPAPGRNAAIRPSISFVSELFQVLKDDPESKMLLENFPYDPQKIPVDAPNFYQYRINSEGNYSISANLYHPYPNTQKIKDNYYKYEIGSIKSPSILPISSFGKEKVEKIREAGQLAYKTFSHILPITEKNFCLSVGFHADHYPKP